MTEDIREVVRQKYAEAISLNTGGCGEGLSGISTCCGGSCNATDIVTSGLYQKIDLEGLPEDMMAWAGCIAGALRKEEYQQKLSSAVFID